MGISMLAIPKAPHEKMASRKRGTKILVIKTKKFMYIVSKGTHMTRELMPYHVSRVFGSLVLKEVTR